MPKFTVQQTAHYTMTRKRVFEIESDSKEQAMQRFLSEFNTADDPDDWSLDQEPRIAWVDEYVYDETEAQEDEA